MKLLVNERKLIIAIGSALEYGVWGNADDQPSWKISDNYFMMDNNYALIDIGSQEIPTYVNVGQYYYIDGEFRLADECPNEYRERITALEANDAELLYQVCLLQLGITEDDF